MKTLTLKNILIIAAVTLVIAAFVTAAVIHIIHLTEAGYINWRD